MEQIYIAPFITSPGAKLPLIPLPRAPQSQSKSPSPSTTASSESSAPPVRKTRIGRPKVKTGCITCKIRRVKCDEAKPECERCTSTGRKCDGYVTPPPKKNTSKSLDVDFEDLVISPSINWQQGDFAERRAIDFFRCHTAPSVSGYFDTDFWSSLVLQVSQSEPAVRHALVAVGALNERRDVYIKDVTYSRSVVTTSSQNVEGSIRRQREQHNDPFALAQYNKAISHLAKAMNSKSSDSIDTALLVCILFVCVECLRGDYRPALKHFEGGMHIALSAAGAGGPNHRDSQATAVRKKLIPFFNRLELLGQLYGQRPSYEYGLEPSEVLPQSFHSIVEARDSIVHIMNLAIRSIHSTKFRRYNNNLTSADFVRHSEIVACALLWKETLDSFLLLSPSSPRLTEAATILEIQQIVTLTWLNRSLVPEECAADADIPLYERVVFLAETITTAPSDPNRNNSTSTFLFDMEIVSPLYLVAIKCRHPLIRRRAIALLRSYVRREGLWDSVKAAAVAERVMELEEVELEIWDGSELPREEIRVANCHIDSGPGLNPSGHKVTFFTMPEGVRGKWRVWDEWLELRP